MQPTTPPPSSSTALRRYGPIIAIVVVIAVVAAVVLVNRNSDSKTDASAPTTAAPATGGYHPADVVSWTQAKAEGKTKDIDWGSRCDTSKGTLKYPSFFAGDCFKPFKGDNGGATYEGVTADTIKVVMYMAEPNDPILAYITGSINDQDTNEQTAATDKDWVKFFQTYYETYGRKVDLIPFVATGAASDEVAARADATTISETIKPFAVIGGPILTASFGQKIIDSKIFCLNCVPSQPNEFYAKNAPYALGLATNADEFQITLSEYVSKQLNNRKAIYAGDSAMHSENRKFGLVYISTGQDSETQTKHFVDNLAKGGVHLSAQLAYQSPTNIDASGIIAQLKSAGVTSVMFVGDPVAPGPLTKAATNQNYHPEWILSGTPLADTALFARTYDQEQWKHAFGISAGAARTDPSVSGGLFLYKWFFGKNPPAATGSQIDLAQLNLFYAAIQGIGPDLTPQHFVDALFSAAPTPEALTQPSISYGNKHIWPETDYNGVDDVTEVWWNPEPSGPDELNHDGKGLYEFIDGGKRYLPGHLPSTAPNAFTTEGAVTIYKTAPKEEQVPTYPSPAAQ